MSQDRADTTVEVVASGDNGSVKVSLDSLMLLIKAVTAAARSAALTVPASVELLIELLEEQLPLPHTPAASTTIAMGKMRGRYCLQCSRSQHQ